MHTPSDPSVEGPRELHEKGVVASGEAPTRSECCTVAIAGVT